MGQSLDGKVNLNQVCKVFIVVLFFNDRGDSHMILGFKEEPVWEERLHIKGIIMG